MKQLKIKQNIERAWLPQWWRVYDSYTRDNIAYFKFKSHAIKYIRENKAKADIFKGKE